MFENLSPDYYFTSIYDIPMEFFKLHNISVILADLDNTLVDDEQHNRPVLFDRWFADLSNNDITLIIVSNNRKRKRVANFVNTLPIEWHHFARKQNGKLFTKIITQSTIDKQHFVAIGDRVTTDIIGGNKAGITTILTAPIVPDKNVFIRLIRAFEKKFIPPHSEKRGNNG
ncbi:MAG: YqeG family HAD IIIA-type phosphatase [Culicoidibacterales bacterium]